MLRVFLAAITQGNAVLQSWRPKARLGAKAEAGLQAVGVRVQGSVDIVCVPTQ